MIYMNIVFPNCLVVRQGPFRLLEAESRSYKTAYRLYGKCIADLRKIMYKLTENYRLKSGYAMFKGYKPRQEVVKDE